MATLVWIDRLSAVAPAAGVDLCCAVPIDLTRYVRRPAWPTRPSESLSAAVSTEIMCAPRSVVFVLVSARWARTTSAPGLSASPPRPSPLLRPPPRAAGLSSPSPLSRPPLPGCRPLLPSPLFWTRACHCCLSCRAGCAGGRLVGDRLRSPHSWSLGYQLLVVTGTPLAIRQSPSDLCRC